MISVEMCAGAGGQALGLEKAGFEHSALVELDPAGPLPVSIWSRVVCPAHRFPRPAFNAVRMMSATCFQRPSVWSMKSGPRP